MKKILFYISILGITGLALIIINFASGATPTATNTNVNLNYYVKNFCFGGQFNHMDTSDVIKEYLKQTNNFFNKNITKIMKNPEKMDPIPTLDDYNKNKLTLCADPTDTTCRTIAVCQDNASAYCVGVNTLGFDGRNLYKYKYDELQKIKNLQYSYFCYKAVLEAKANDVQEETGQRILAKCNWPDSPYKNNDICTLKQKVDQATNINNKQKAQASLNLMLQNYGYSKNITGIDTSIVERSNAITTEIKRSKQVLDVTLSAYSQLQMAWKLHVKYIDIYNALVKYRDALVKVRKQTDQFPLRFIDASTTRCT